MRPFIVSIATWLLLGCGRDPILEAAAEKEAEADAQARPSADAPEAGVPAEPTPGVPKDPQPGTPGAVEPGAPGAPAPGKPVEPAPGIPEEPAPANPGSPQPGSGPTVTLSGTVEYAAWTTGAVRITAFDADHSRPSPTPPRVVGAGTIERPGPFTISVPEGAGKVYVEAAIDEDADGRPGPLEPQGRASRYPVTVGDDPVEGLTVELHKREPPPGTVQEKF